MLKEVYLHAQYFAETCRERISGVHALGKAASYVTDYFEGSDMRIERHGFAVPICSVEHSALQKKEGEDWKGITHTAVLFSGTTGWDGIILPLLCLEEGMCLSDPDLELRGKAVLLFRDVCEKYPDVETFKSLHEAGAKMVIFTTSPEHEEVPYVYANWEYKGEDYMLPAAVIHERDARKLHAEGATEIRYKAIMSVREEASLNTFGLIEGTDKKDETIIVCAHLDTGKDSVGARDSAAGIGIVLELALEYARLEKLGKRPRRTIRFAAWSGHECSFTGSREYLLEHPEVLKSTRFVLNFDSIGGTENDYRLMAGCGAEIEAGLLQLLADNVCNWPIEVSPHLSDTLSFAGQGIPHITLTQEKDTVNHTALDTMDRISLDGIVKPLAFAEAVLSWAANAESLPQGYADSLFAAFQNCTDRNGIRLIR